MSLSSPSTAPSPVDRAEFRQALGLFPTGVAVVTAEGPAGEGRIGMTITSFNSVSLAPPLVLFSIARTALSLPVLCAAGHYSINVLGEEHRHVSQRFATAKGDKWAGTDVDLHEGLPFTLRQSIVSFQCRPYAQHEGGDHLIFIGEVLRLQRREGCNPLVFFGGGYAAVAPAAASL